MMCASGSSGGAGVIGVLGAMEPEIAMLKKHITDVKEIKVNDMLTFYAGTYKGKSVVFGTPGVGTVFAATAATMLCTQFKVDAILFTGVAGGLQMDQKIGDIVLATDCVNYDMDITKFVPFPGFQAKRGQLPFIDWREYPADPKLLKLAKAAPLPESVTAKGCKVREGRLLTGSVFVDVPGKKALMEMCTASDLGSPEAVEMECAAVAQVCRAFSKPFLGLRALSDNMAGDANADFNAFTVEAAESLWPIVAHIIEEF